MVLYKLITPCLKTTLLDVNFGLTGQDEVYSKVGNRADGEKIDGYTVANFSARVSDEQWGVTFYVDNLFDEYAFTAVRRDKRDIGEGLFENSNGSDTILRNYSHYLLKPRTVGIRVDYQFDAF